MKKEIMAEKIKKALLQLNMTEKEILCYVALLESGSSTIQDISRFTGVNRVTIYAAIEELKGKSLVFETRKGRRKLFVAEGPEELKSILEEKKDQIRAEEKILEDLILPTLKAVDARQENKPQIKFFEGAEGINKVFDGYILKAREAINCGSYETATKVVSMKHEIGYFKDLEKRKIFYRMILEDTPLNRKFAEIGKGIVHVKFLPPETKIFADIVIAGSITALISYENKTATLIEDTTISQAIKLYLEFMWERL